ncbi:MAG: diacylglycerol kinase family protein [Nitriliruptoraceae bacterium]
MTPLGRPLLIVNPAAGHGRRAVLSRLQAGLRHAGVDHDVVMTQARGHAVDIARAAVADGRRYLIAVGGDGTIHEVVNGLIDPTTGRAHAAETVLGIVSAGSGSDFARTFGLDRSPERLVRHLLGDAWMEIDLGRIRLTGLDGGERAVVFANVAEAGFGARAARVAGRLPRRWGQARYAVGIVAAWGKFRRVETTVTVDGGTITERLCNVIAANGQFFGGGLHVAPRAVPADGRFDVQTWGGSVTDVVRASRLLRRGDHLARDDVRAWSSTALHVDARQPLPVEADGEYIGTTPASFDVLHKVLRLKL